MYGIIYKATCTVNGKAYIGQTTKTLEKRIKQHKNNAFLENRKCAFYNAFHKYGFENFTWEVLATAKNRNELDELEKHFIKEFNTWVYAENSKGYNVLIGGNGNCKGNKLAEETKQKMKKAYKYCPERVRKTKEFFKMHPEIKINVACPIYAYEVEGDAVYYFESLTQAEQFIEGASVQHINDVLKGRKVTHAGFKFEYVTEEDKAEFEEIMQLIS